MRKKERVSKKEGGLESSRERKREIGRRWDRNKEKEGQHER